MVMAIPPLFALRLIRLATDSSSSVLTNVGAALIGTGDASAASICISIAAALTAVKNSAEHYLDQEEQREAETAIQRLAGQFGTVHEAIKALAEGRVNEAALSEHRAREFLGLIESDESPDLVVQHNEILFQIVRFLETAHDQNAAWQSSLQQQLAAFEAEQRAEMTRLHIEVADVGGRASRTADSVERVEQTLHTQHRTASLAAMLSPDEYFRPYRDKTRLFHHAWDVVGRDPQLQELKGVLLRTELRVAIVPGRGGIGKTAVIKALCETVLAEFPGWTAFVVRADSDLVALDQQYFPDGKYLLILDDAHRCDEVRLLADFVSRAIVPMKLILGTRPHATERVRSDLLRGGIDATQIITLKPLEELAKVDRVALARQALGDQYGEYAERLAVITWDCTLVTVVAAQLVARKQIDVRLLDNQADFRVQVLEQFRQQICDDITGIVEPAVLDRLLPLIAAVSPVWPSNPALIESMARFLKLPKHELIKAIDDLACCGLLIGKGRAVRIVPDVLGDYLLRRECLSCSGQSTGYADAVFAAFAGVCPQQVLRNLAELDWRVQQDDTRTSGILDSIWATIEQQFDETDSSGKYGILETLKRIAYHQPNPMMRLIKKAKTTDDADLRRLLPGLLREIAFNLVFRRECCDLLWQIGRDSSSLRTGLAPDGFAMLVGLAEYQPYLPIVFYDTVLDAVEVACTSPDAHDHAHSLLDVVDQLLKKTGMSRLSDRYQVTMSPFIVPHEATAAIRKRSLDLLERTARDSRPKVAARAVQSLALILQPAELGFGRSLTDAQNSQWDPDRQRAVGILADILANRDDAVIKLMVRIELLLNAYFCPESQIAQQGKSIALGTALTADMTLVDILWSRRHRYEDFDLTKDCREHSVIDFNARMAAASAQIFARVRKMVSDLPDVKECLSTLQRLAMSIEATGNEAKPWNVARCLATDHPAYAAELASLILLQGCPRFGSIVGVLISGVRNVDCRRADELLVRAVASADVDTRRSVTHCLWQAQSVPRDAPNKEHACFEPLLQDADDGVRRDAVLALRRLRDDDPTKALNYAVSVNVGSDAGLADDLCLLFAKKDGGIIDCATERQIVAMIDKLAAINIIEQHWIMGFLDAASLRFPERVFDLLLSRVDIGNQHRRNDRYQVFPYSHSPYRIKGLAQSAGFQDMLRRLRDRLGREKGASAFWTAELFWRLTTDARDPRPVEVLLEWVKLKDTAKTQCVAKLLERAPSNLIMDCPELVCRILDAIDDVDREPGSFIIDALRHAARSEGKQGTPGRPFPEDERRRDKAAEFAKRFPVGSRACRFYERLQQAAEAEITGTMNRWAEEELEE